MYIEAVPNWNSPPAILLRESYRQDGKVRKRTLCNLSDWPTAYIEGLRGAPKGGTVIPAEREAFTVIRSLPPGHSPLRSAPPDGSASTVSSAPTAIAVVISFSPCWSAGSSIPPPSSRSTCAFARHGCIKPRRSVGFGYVDEDELYAALDWLLERQPLMKPRWPNAILAMVRWRGRRVIQPHGRTRRPLANRGYSRDGKKGTLQIVYGLLCVTRLSGCHPGVRREHRRSDDAGDADRQVKQRFRLDHVVLVGDRGMVTQARITEEIKLAGLDWITALRAPAIKALVESGALQLSLFDQRDLASITAPDFPDERLVVCATPISQPNAAASARNYSPPPVRPRPHPGRCHRSSAAGGTPRSVSRSAR